VLQDDEVMLDGAAQEDAFVQAVGNLKVYRLGEELLCADDVRDVERDVTQAFRLQLSPP